MNNPWLWAALRRLLGLLLLALLAGVITGQYAWMLVLGLSGYLAWMFSQTLRLNSWLESPISDEPPPDSFGLWGEIFDRIYRLQRRDQKVRGRMQAVIDRIQESTAALRDAVIMVDSEGTLDWWNRAAETLLGLRSPQDSGQPIGNLVRDPRFKDYFDKRDYREPLEIPAPSKPHLRLQFHVTLYGQGDRLLLVRDVTRMHQLEQMRKDFVANVSHELRTPLTVITGYLETLLDNSDDLNPRWKRALQQMQQQGGRMQNLLNDLLLLARLETTDYPADSQPVAVDLLLLSIQQDAIALSGSAHHKISVDNSTRGKLKGSSAELRSAFSNLIFNAVKYTPAEGQISIRWWQDEQGGHLSVSDSGIGIEPQHLPRLTERFYRVDASRSSATGGTGLGLAIVKHVLLRHKGRLEISSVPGQGSTFTCHFPTSQLSDSKQPVIS
ncbi:two-component system, OmpR family, phosphate regulon sensor histidine kinase PhoR [Atopomonas hussainii]|uniref:Phosphate regulon sensor protein PhoR n=1 Tax=Atopomonas hussainii TaxID=1429083 RepID=A0A1H7NAD5_9GAMM|nr:phosphate regulon sensor histidine kinase PhoR [Atopomonas hussainii]SEL20239.1 two-component system, OmpR family, phosphate regulon sensor histidine kinase PhoR [Atopomonas hussainii]